MVGHLLLDNRWEFGLSLGMKWLNSAHSVILFKSHWRVVGIKVNIKRHRSYSHLHIYLVLNKLFTTTRKKSGPIFVPVGHQRVHASRMINC